MRISQDALRVVAGLALVAGVVGCASAVHPTYVPPEPDEDQFFLPLDEFKVPDYAVNYARDLITRDCLMEQEIDYPVVEINIDARGPETANAVARGIFNAELAAKYGYHAAPTDRFDRGLAIQVITEAEAVVAQHPESVAQCQDASRREVPFDGTPTAEELAFYIDVDRDEEILATIESWRLCMLATIPAESVAASPNEMPVSQDAVRFGIRELNLTQQPPDVTPEELTLAIVDAHCRETSGYAATYYAATWDLHLELIEEHLDQLVSERDTARRQEQAARDILAGRSSDT